MQTEQQPELRTSSNLSDTHVPFSVGFLGEAMSNDEIAACLSVVMPVYNEEATVASVVKTVLSQRPVQELIVVDDCSSDGTWRILQALGSQDKRLRLIHHEQNQGKGAALRTGFRHASSPVVIIQDADFEYSPEEYYRVLAPILSGKADVVYGSRFIGSGAHRVLYFWHSVGNKLLTMLSNMATNLNLTDMETCYKAFRKEVIEKIVIEENRFGFEPEITAKVSKLRVRLYEVAISYHGRTYEEGKKINWRDGFSALRCILKYKSAPAMRERPNATAQTEDFEFAALAEARNYRRAIFTEFRSVLRGEVLEVGAGIGQMTEQLLKLPEVSRTLGIEPNPGFCAQFRARLPKCELLEGTVSDLPADAAFDAILCLNVLEHIQEDIAELTHFAKLLRARHGALCLFVPARPEIYALIDKDFGHFRRYTRPELGNKLSQGGFRIEQLYYFNFVGYFAWWLNFCVLKKRGFEVQKVRAFDRMIFPLVHWLESKLVRPRIGQSLLAIARPA